MRLPENCICKDISFPALLIAWAMAASLPGLSSAQNAADDNPNCHVM